MGISYYIIRAVTVVLISASGYVFGFEVNGRVTLWDGADIDPSLLENGTNVTGTFSVNIGLEEDFENVFITISGDTLEFRHDRTVLDVEWTLRGDTEWHDRNSSDLTFQESLYSRDPNNTGKVYVLNITDGLGTGQWVFNGTFLMAVTDEVYQGSIVRSVITIIVSWDPYNMTSRTINSNYVIIPPPTIRIEAKSPLTQPIMGLFTTHVILYSERKALGVEVESLTPFENVSNEVKLTVQSMHVSRQDAHGISSDRLDDLVDLHEKLTSTLGSYQNNMAVLTLPPTPRDAALADNMTLTIQFTVRVEDYSQLADGDELPVFMRTSFQNNIIWTGNLPVTLEAPEVRMPQLRISMAQIGQCAYDGSATVKVTVFVSHELSSTATAYNVTVNMYLADYMALQSKSYTVPKENTISVTQADTVITAEIARLTFSDPFTLELSLSLDMPSLQVREASSRVVTAEAIYNDRWQNLTDHLTDTVYKSLYADKICAKRLEWTMSSTCTCEHDPSRADCGCCVSQSCQCAPPVSHKCVPCQEMWRCREFLNRFDKISEFEPLGIRCDAHQRKKLSSTDVSCYRVLPREPVTFQELSPVLGVLTGYRGDTGYYYGIGNTGRTYVVSPDRTVTWITLPDDEYNTMTSHNSFLRANFT